MSTTNEERESRAPVLALRSAVGHLIRRTQQVHTALWGQEFEGELTGPQYALLSALRNSPIDQRSAGRAASLDKSTAADIVARLQRSGWVAREKDPRDGRRYLLTLTMPAKSALKHITPRVADIQRRLLEPIAPRDRDRFTESLARVAFGGEPPASAESEPVVVLPLTTTPGHLIRRSEQLHGVYWARRVGSALTPPQYALLSAVAWNSPIDLSGAGELASLDKSSMTDIIARLTRRGLVTSVADPADRRRKVVVLSEDARSVLEQVTPDVEAVQRDVLAPLQAGDAEQFVQLLRAVAYR